MLRLFSSRTAKVTAAASVRNPARIGTSGMSQHFHKDYNPTREEQSFRLSDGRMVGFAEYGDLNGVPAFYFHGSPGARYEGSAFIDLGKKLGMRFVCPDRPGHGLSSFHAGRKLGDYPHDIRQLAKHLGFSKYHVFGISGGGPYAVACAYGLPQDELLTASVIAGGGPPETMTFKQAGLYSVVVMTMARYTPNLLTALVNRALRTDPEFESALKALSRLITEEDQAELEDPLIRAMTVATMKEAYAQGPAGVIQDSQVCDATWDFELKDVRKEVKLFYGHKDTRTPIAFGRYYKEHLPKAELVEFEDASHFTIFRYDEQIMRNILGLSNNKEDKPGKST